MNKFREVFGRKGGCSIIGMVHVGALPGTPLYKGSISNIIKNACKEVEIYLKHNVDGILIENMHDIPYVQSKYLEPEITATMTRICTEIRKITPFKVPLGVQVLAGGNKEALAIAKACHLNFIRVEGFVFGHLADEGYTDACAGTLLRYRKKLESDNILIFADIKKKHCSHAITSDVSLIETAKAAEFFLADGLILTGTATGQPANKDELVELAKATSLPILIGSGVTSKNLHQYSIANALIIGSSFKVDGQWQNQLDENRIKEVMDARNLLK